MSAVARVARALALAALATGAASAAEILGAGGDGSGEIPETQLEEVLVSGEQAGPGLWKVTHPAAGGDHVLWILGTYGRCRRT